MGGKFDLQTHCRVMASPPIPPEGGLCPRIPRTATVALHGFAGAANSAIFSAIGAADAFPFSSAFFFEVPVVLSQGPVTVRSIGKVLLSRQ